MTLALFDTSSLQRLAEFHCYQLRGAHQVIAALDEYVTVAYVPLLSMMEVVRNSHDSYQFGKRGDPVSPEKASSQAKLARVVVSWCNGQELSPSLQEFEILRWPLQAKIQMVPPGTKALGSVIEDLADIRNARCTSSEGCHLVASSVDHLILASARYFKATLITEDQRLAAAAHHLGVPYRRVQDSPDFGNRWSDCSRDLTCVRRVLPERRHEISTHCDQLKGS